MFFDLLRSNIKDKFLPGEYSEDCFEAEIIATIHVIYSQ